MANVWYVFQSCGFASWLVLLVTIIAIPFTLLAVALAIARVRSAKLIALLALVASFLPVGLGAFGMFLGRSRVDTVLQSGAIDPTFVERIRIEGYKEADGCVTLGLGAGAFPMLVAFVAVALAVALARKDV